jgi:flagellar biosynthetic protein FliO
MGSTPDLGYLLYYKVLGGLLLVLALLFLVAYGLKRWGHFLNRSTAGQRIHILVRQPLGPKHYLLLVEVLDRTLLLGVSPEGIHLLTPLAKAASDSDNMPPAETTAETQEPFQAMLDHLTGSKAEQPPNKGT